MKKPLATLLFCLATAQAPLSSLEAPLSSPQKGGSPSAQEASPTGGGLVGARALEGAILSPQGEPEGASVGAFPFPILGGELSNSAATCVEDIDEVMPRMAALGLNTVLVPAYWEFIEPVEGVFDFTLVDRVIDRARENQLKVVFLWFGAWKNSMSCYAPAWFKVNTTRFPRAMTRAGKQLEIASCFSDEVLQADLRAFTRLMEHLAVKDRKEGTVIMMQIENEIGMLEDARDHSPLANAVYEREQWAERYGTDIYADEKFMALHYAQYVEHLAQAARRIYPMPLYVNAALNSRGRRPGEYPSAGPLAHLIDFWRAGAPSIDFFAPDIYDTGFKSWCQQYDMRGKANLSPPLEGKSNTQEASPTGGGLVGAPPTGGMRGGLPPGALFIPETRCCANAGVRALYAFGEHQAIGFSPFAIDQAPTTDTTPITQAYALLKQLAPLLPPQREARTFGLLFDQDDRERIIDDGGTILTCRHNFTLPWDPRATDGTPWPEGGAIIIRLAHLDYIIAGNGVVVDFKTRAEKQQEQQKILGEDGFEIAPEAQAPKNQAPLSSPQKGGSPSAQKASPTGGGLEGARLGILSVDQVSVLPDGSLQYIRRDNGDQDHQGRHARIGVGEWKILHVQLYDY